ncbi:MAG: 16S rRNA (cytosine(1402)-N(4))-methyltransferase [Rhodospirillales bacterium]|nr:16S rRNA (cytosine(1402)-N(4))-methyltransferase [Rhodospirillales bacterium]
MAAGGSWRLGCRPPARSRKKTFTGPSSLEHRPVRRFSGERSGGRQPNRPEPPAATKSPDPTFTLLTRRARKPDGAEVSANPRARSARLRAAERTAAPPWHERLVA